MAKTQDWDWEYEAVTGATTSRRPRHGQQAGPSPAPTQIEPPGFGCGGCLTFILLSAVLLLGSCASYVLSVATDEDRIDRDVDYYDDDDPYLYNDNNEQCVGDCMDMDNDGRTSNDVDIDNDGLYETPP